jgi:ABC-2 type transport system ATP-binding protein
MYACAATGNTVNDSADIVLRVDGLTKRYGDITAVDDLSLAVRRGEILGFLGPNGAGKTTTLKMLSGLLRPDAGTIEVDGQAVPAGQMRGRRTLGVSPQEIVVWEMLTCLEQLEFMGAVYDMEPAAARKKAVELLDVFGLKDKSHRLARTLSGGMKRRLNIALGLIHDPEILLLDEPQAGLDPQSRVLVREYVGSLAGKMTVVVTTHDMEEAEKLSHRVCIIDAGKLLVLDTVEGIKNTLGEGDLCEVEISEDPETALLPHLDQPARDNESLRVVENTIRFTTTTGAELLSDVLHTVKTRNLQLRHLRMRKTTLEDVFIHLTGKGLRE